jgi:2-oxoglutarate ferredoxin oxidoreductase subunit alpha
VIDRVKPTVPPDDYLPFNFDIDGAAPLASFGGDYTFHITTSMHGVNGYASTDPANAARRISHLHRKIEANRDEIVLTRSYDTEDCDVLIVAAGAVTRTARQAALEARKSGVKVGVLQLITIWPFPDKEIMAAASKAKTVIVAEMNYAGQLAGEVLKAVGHSVELKKVNTFNGEVMYPQAILQAIQGTPGNFAAGAK